VGYDAFISYSHAADGKLAPAVEKGLEQLAKPWSKRRALNVFRDDTGLAVDPSLWSSIRTALDQSDWFILLASPAAAESEWVSREVSRWLEVRSADRILPVVTDGSWAWDTTAGDLDWSVTDAAPPALRGVFQEEPRHLDLRWARDETQLDLRHSGFRDGIAQLAAPIRGIPKDELEGEDIRLHRRTRRLRRAAIVGLAALTVAASVAGVIAVVNAREASRQADVARENEAEALRQRDSALSRQLAAESSRAVDDGRVDLGLLLAVESYRLGDASGGGADLLHRSTVEAFEALFASIVEWPQLATHLHGHDAPVTAVALSPDGMRAVSGDQAGTVILWDVATGVELARDNLGEPPGILAFSGDGRMLAAGGVPGPRPMLHLWDTTTLEVPRTLTAFYPGVDGAFSELALDATGSLVAVAPEIEDGSVPGMLLIDTVRDDLLWRVHSVSSEVETITHAEFSADGREILAATEERMWSFAVADGSLHAVPFAAQGSSHFTVSRDGAVVAETGSRGTRALDIATGEELTVGVTQPMSRVALSPDGGLLMGVTESDGRNFLHLSSVGQFEFNGFPVGDVHDLAVSSTGVARAVGASGTAVVVWDATRVPAATTSLPFPGVSDVTPDWRHAVGVEYDAEYELTLRDLRSDDETVISKSDAPGVPAVLSPDGSRLAVGDVPFRLWSVDPLEVVTELHAESPSGESTRFWEDVAFSPDGGLLAAKGSAGENAEDSFVVVWSVADGRALTVIPMRFAVERTRVPASVYDLEFDSTGTLLLASSRPAAEGNVSARIHVWDARTGEERVRVETDTIDVALSPDGRTLASVGYRTVQLGAFDTGVESLPRLDRGENESGRVFRNAAFSRDGSVLAISSDGLDQATNRIELWDPVTRRRLGAPLHVGRDGTTNRIRFDQVDGVENLTWLSPFGAHRFPLDPDAWIETACELAGRDLSRAEWERHVSVEIAYRQTC
jgi:WD40 repeat protein